MVRVFCKRVLLLSMPLVSYAQTLLTSNPIAHLFANIVMLFIQVFECLGTSADHATELVCTMIDMLNRGMHLPLRISHAFTSLIPNKLHLSCLPVDVQAQGFQACWMQLLKVRNRLMIFWVFFFISLVLSSWWNIFFLSRPMDHGNNCAILNTFFSTLL
jgi:hypothetical protein